MDSLCPISDDLITGLLLQGSFSEVGHAELVLFCDHTPVITVCHIYLLCPFQSYLVSDGPSGSLSYPPPPGSKMPLPWPPMLLGIMQHLYQGTQGTQSLQLFWASSRGGAANSLLGAAMVRHFCSRSICSFHLEALSRCLSWDSRGHRLISDWLASSACRIRDSQESSQAPQFRSSILWHSPCLMVPISHLYRITGKTIALTLQTSIAK